MVSTKSSCTLNLIKWKELIIIFFSQLDNVAEFLFYFKLFISLTIFIDWRNNFKYSMSKKVLTKFNSLHVVLKFSMNGFINQLKLNLRGAEPIIQSSCYSKMRDLSNLLWNRKLKKCNLLIVWFELFTLIIIVVAVINCLFQGGNDYTTSKFKGVHVKVKVFPKIKLKAAYSGP